MTDLIVLENVTKIFSPQSRPAIESVSFRIRDGEKVALVGQSGSGKTTILNIALGFTRPSSGRVQIANRHTTGLVFQNPQSSLDPRWTVEKIIREGNSDISDDDIAEVLSSVSLDYVEMKKRYVSELSGGQAQRVAFARALASHPQLLVADEPMSAVDVLGKQQIVDTIIRLQSSYHLASLFVLHDVGIAQKIAERIIVMKDGKIVEEGATSDIIESPHEEYTRQLIHAVRL